MAANVSQLTLAELQRVLCHGEDFALKQFVWFALDAPADFVEEHQEHCLASRLGTSPAHLASLFAGWLTQGGRPYLENRSKVFLTELRRVRETSLLELSFWTSVENLTTELGRTKRRIRCASVRLLRRAHTRTPTRGPMRPMRRWVLFGASNMEGGALSQQLGADALVKPEPVAATRAALAAHRAAVVAAAAEERDAAACASAEVEQTASAVCGDGMGWPLALASAVRAATAALGVQSRWAATCAQLSSERRCAAGGLCPLPPPTHTHACTYDTHTTHTRHTRTISFNRISRFSRRVLAFSYISFSEGCSRVSKLAFDRSSLYSETTFPNNLPKQQKQPSQI